MDGTVKIDHVQVGKTQNPYTIHPWGVIWVSSGPNYMEIQFFEILWRAPSISEEVLALREGFHRPPCTRAVLTARLGLL